MGWGGRSEGAARAELSVVPTLVWDQRRRERLLGAATPGPLNASAVPGEEWRGCLQPRGWCCR